MRVFEDRISMLSSLIGKNKKIVEIGIFQGKFSKQLRSELQPSSLYLVDLFDGICCSGDEHGNNVVNANLTEQYAMLKDEFKDSIDVEVIKSCSYEWLNKQDDCAFDAVYVDGDHSEEGCYKDLVAAWRTIKPGGFLCGHDYEMNMNKAHTYYNFGVKNAVSRFCSENNVSVCAKGMDGCVSFCIQKPLKILAYFTVGFSAPYYDLFKFAYTVFHKTNPNIDVAILLDENIESGVVPSNIHIIRCPKSETPERASMRKLEVFQYIKNIEKYDVVLYIDTDILVIESLYNCCLDIFNMNEDIAVYTEHDSQDNHTHIFWSLHEYTESELELFQLHDIKVFNAGFFGFRPSATVKHDFATLCDTMQKWDKPFFYEQSFMNVFYNTKDAHTNRSATNRNIFTTDNYVLFPKMFEQNKIIYHFAGGPGNSGAKLNRMITFVQSLPKTDDDIIEHCKQYSMISVDRFRANIAAIKHVEDKGVDGDVVEIGVWKGGSILSMIMKYETYNKQNREFYLYDTFEGMTPPAGIDKDLNNNSAEDLLKINNWFNCEAPYELVKHTITSSTSYPLVKYIVGDICKNTTYPSNKIAVLRLDTDWYESTKAELDTFYPLVASGGVVIIDDYGHWQGCRKAVDEFLAVHPEIQVHRIDYTGVYFVKPV